MPDLKKGEITAGQVRDISGISPGYPDFSYQNKQGLLRRKGLVNPECPR